MRDSMMKVYKQKNGTISFMPHLNSNCTKDAYEPYNNTCYKVAFKCKNLTVRIEARWSLNSRSSVSYDY